MVGADAHGAAKFFAAQNDRRERLVQALEFFGIGGVGIFEDGELLFVGVIAWVDADFFDVQRGFHCSGWQEVYVGDQWHVALGGTKLLGDFTEGSGRGFIGCCDTDDLAASFSQGERLCDGGVDVLCVGRRHRLDADRVVAADSDIADVDDT